MTFAIMIPFNRHCSKEFHLRNESLTITVSCDHASVQIHRQKPSNSFRTRNFLTSDQKRTPKPCGVENFSRSLAMDVDELTYNSFYILLREKFRRKYESAISKCWTICVPCSDSLKGLNITENFIDDHILQPIFNRPCYFVSTDSKNRKTYKIEGTFIKLVQQQNDGTEVDGYKVKIVNIERGYNKEFHSYNIVIVEKPLDLKYSATCSLPSARMKLNRTINCYKEAVNFLHELSSQEHCSLSDLRADLQSTDTDRYNSAEELRACIQDLVRRHWAKTMRRHSLDVQRDVRFQKLLSVSLEIFIMHHLHDSIYTLLSDALDQDDLCVKKKIDQLIDVGVTADQLGAKESLAIALPSAIVELATLDAREGPQEKLSCLKTTLDLTIAEIKGALAAVETRMDFPRDNDFIGARKSILVVPTDDLIPLLIYVIVKSRPRRLITDLHYIQNFLWSISPHDGLSYTIVTFKTAICALQDIDLKRLPARSCKVKNELPISEALDVLGKADNEATPLDRQVRQLADMLGECTRN